MTTSLIELEGLKMLLANNLGTKEVAIKACDIIADSIRAEQQVANNLFVAAEGLYAGFPTRSHIEQRIALAAKKAIDEYDRLQKT